MILKKEPEEDLQEEGEVCDEKLARSTSALGGTVQESSEVHARMHARDPSCGTEVSDEEAKVVLSDHPRKYESGYEERGFNDRPKRYSAFRQKFPNKLWTSVAHSFLQQIAQNKN